MKNNTISKIVILFCLFFNIGCSKEDSSKADSISNLVTLKGNFISSAHPTSGKISVNPEKTLLTFTDFKTDSGPNLDIYLVSNLSNVNGDYKNLGDIKGVNGNYTYEIPPNIDLTTYKYVVVWCSSFNVNFGYAELTQ